MLIIKENNMKEINYLFRIKVTISVQCGNMIFHEISRIVDLENITKQVLEFGKQFQLLSDNIEVLKDATDEELSTISSLIGITLSKEHIRNYIKDHLFFELEEGSLVATSYKIEKDIDSNVF